jgi:hypothetical protein
MNARTRAGSVTLLDPQPPVARMLDLLCIDEMFSIRRQAAAGAGPDASLSGRAFPRSSRGRDGQQVERVGPAALYRRLRSMRTTSTIVTMRTTVRSAAPFLFRRCRAMVDTPRTILRSAPG